MLKGKEEALTLRLNSAMLIQQIFTFVNNIIPMGQYSITEPFAADHRIKGSKFLSYLFPCESQETAEKHLEDIKSLHPTATHHCYAYRVDPGNCTEFSQDDGEPAGTAGLPILNELKSVHLVNAICIVVRYYGGAKLGKSGLIDAYSAAARMAIQKASLKKITPTTVYAICYPYSQQSLIEKLRHTFTLFETGSDYAENVTLKLECPIRQQAAFEKRLEAISHLLISVDKKYRSFHIEP